jgi:hypothetical protein
VYVAAVFILEVLTIVYGVGIVVWVKGFLCPNMKDMKY